MYLFSVRDLLFDVFAVRSGQDRGSDCIGLYDHYVRTVMIVSFECFFSILSFAGVFPSRRHCVSLNGIISDLKVGPGTYRVRIAVWPWHIIVVESTLAVLPRQHV